MKKSNTKNNTSFWFETKTGMKISKTKLYRLLNSIGIWLINLNKSWFIIEETGGVIREVDETYLAQTIMNHIRNQDLTNFEIDLIEEAFRNSAGRIISKDQLQLLEVLETSLKKDTKEECFLFYQNSWVKVTKERVLTLPYHELDGHVWQSKIIDREFQGSPTSLNELIGKCDFAEFIWNVSDKKENRFESLCSMIGYLIHEYNDPSVNKAVVFMDEKISENPEGGTGKGIVMNGISKMRETVVQDGKNFTFDTRFAYQDVSHSTSVLAFDDVKRNFDSESLFSVLTDGINIEQKGKQRYRITKSDVPKILINTNFVLKGNGNSHNRRRCVFEFSQHYNGNNTPFGEFGYLFFSEWNDEQWSHFDNFMIRCVQLFLGKGIVETESINLNQKSIESETCREFVEFISNYRINRKLNRTELMVKFENDYPEISRSKWYTNYQFCKWLRLYARHKGYEYSEIRSKGDVIFTFIHIEPDTTNNTPHLRTPSLTRLEKFKERVSS